ncbi:MAG TPA: hypothetical protein VF501_10975, partial [Thiobacillus sp.]
MRLLFWCLLGAYLIAVLAQRAFPSQDGPVHLYYADVVNHLMAGDRSYGAYFGIKHWVPPYAFHYYALIALTRFLRPLQAEKALVCAYTICFCLAFRYLLRGVAAARESGAADAWSLLAFPFVHNRTLYLGFYNFSFGVAASLFLAGYWLRHSGELTVRRIAVVLLLVLALAMTHPVALAVALLAMGAHVALVALAALAEYRAAGGTW